MGFLGATLMDQFPRAAAYIVGSSYTQMALCPLGLHHMVCPAASKVVASA